LLLTSRETGRWVIPKGWPIKGLKPYEVAAREAYEEAGLVGTITGKHPVGIYHYEKQFAAGGLLCEVRVFLFRVDQQLDDWPEKGQRETRWEGPAEAAALVDEGGLAEIVRHASHQLHWLTRNTGEQRPRALLPSGGHAVQL
jgi:8-oxo-dGTP pyrophosphatase MutT (NUDIX family)